MEFFNQYTLPPNEGNLQLLRYLLVMTFVIHVPYLALVVACTKISLVFNMRDRDIPNATFARIAKDIMDLAVGNRVVVLTFGVLPQIVLWLIYGQWFAQSNATALDLMPVASVLIAVGLVLLVGYRMMLYPEGRNSAINFATGSIGFLIFVGGTYGFFGVITRVLDPERWHLALDPVRMMLSFNVIWKFMFFVLSGFTLAGCAMFFFFTWSGRKPAMDDTYRTFVKNLGAGVGIVGLLGLPVIGFFYLVTTPIIAMSGGVYILAASTLAVMFVVFTFLYRAILSRTPRFGGTAFTLFLVVFVIVALGDQLTLVNATREHSAALVTEAEAIEAQIALEREAHMAEAGTVDVAEGEELYNTLCVTCHRMDERLVGPPLNAVLRKYEGNPDGLVEFIQKPKKIDPEYPPMPAPALSLREIRSVAAYLLGEDGSSGNQPTGEGH
jgi:cytochrome c